LSVPQAADVFFSIHDVSGTPLIEREFQVAEATVITFLWNGENDSGKRVASGIYICVLKASGTSVREKFFFVRR
jgi:flagellar hook assembly protein FlgD